MNFNSGIHYNAQAIYRSIYLKKNNCWRHHVWFHSGPTFIPYDFGPVGNYLRYKQFRPPPYDLGKVKVPVYLFYGENDRLVTPKVRPISPHSFACARNSLFLVRSINELTSCHALSLLQDIEWLASKLPNVKELVKVDDKYYNHASFLISKNNNVLLNNQLISFLPSPNWRWIFSTQMTL